MPPPFNIIPTLKVSLIYSKVKPVANMTNAKIEWEGRGETDFGNANIFCTFEAKVKFASSLPFKTSTFTSPFHPYQHHYQSHHFLQTIYFLFRCCTGKTNRDLKQRAMSVKVNTIITITIIIITIVKALIRIKLLQHKITLAREKEEQYEAIMQNLVRRYVTEVPYHSSSFLQDFNMVRNIYMR